MQLTKQSQKLAIQHDLEEGAEITPIDALRDYGCFRLSARIYDLRKDGARIRTEIIDTGKGSRVAKYSLKTTKKR